MIAESSKFVEQIEIIKGELAEINRIKQTPVVPDTIGEPDKASLISALYKDDDSFEFEITCTSTVPNPACKGKLIDLELELLNLGNSVIQERDEVPVEVLIYQASNPPEPLASNLSGRELLKGRIKTNLKFERKILRHSGYVKFSINEVTSNLENGWVFLVVKTAEEAKVKPFVSERLVILAKERTCKKWRDNRKVA